MFPPPRRRHPLHSQRQARPRLETLEPRLLLSAGVPVEAPDVPAPALSPPVVVRSPSAVDPAWNDGTPHDLKAATSAPEAVWQPPAERTWQASGPSRGGTNAPGQGLNVEELEDDAGSLFPPVGWGGDPNAWIIREDDGLPNDTFDAAQTLPVHDSMEVRGRFDPNDCADLYRMQFDSLPRILHIKLATMAPNSTVREQIWLFDGRGNVVGNWAIKQPWDGVTIRVDTTDMASDQTLYLGVTSEGPIEADAEPEYYNLRIQSTPLSEDTGGGGYEPGTPVPPPVGGSAPGPGSGGPAAPQPSASIAPNLRLQDVVAITRGALVPGMVGLSRGLSGPLPSRGVAPRGGVVVDHDPAPPVQRDGSADLDPVLLARTVRDGAIEEAPRDLELPVLTVLRGPGGLPLAAALRPRSSSARPSPLPARSPLIAADSEVAPAEAKARQAVEAPTASRRARRHLPLPAAVGAVTALAFALVLPDLAATLHFHRPKRPLPRIVGLPDELGDEAPRLD